MDRRVWQRYDFVLTITTMLLLGYGVMMIYSASHDVPAIADSAMRQAIFAAGGILIGLGVTWIDYRLYDSLVIPGYVLMIVLLVLVLLVGQVSFGAQRSIDLGIIDLQPSELSKLLMIISLAAFLARREEQVGRLSTLILSILLTALPVFLIYREPDLGTSLVLIFIWVVMIFASGMPLLYLGILAGAGVAAVPLLWMVMRDYMRKRLIIFLNPKSDPQAYYNIEQALFAIGSGGWWGKGYMQGTQSQLGFLVVQHTDFIFSVIGEEMGLIGALLLFVLFAVLLLRILRAAHMARDTFGRLICVGVAAWFFFQAGVNIGMNLNLLPVTGLPLPLISYGGSSLVPMLVTLGIVQSVLLRHRKIEF